MRPLDLADGAGAAPQEGPQEAAAVQHAASEAVRSALTRRELGHLLDGMRGPPHPRPPFLQLIRRTSQPRPRIARLKTVNPAP